MAVLLRSQRGFIPGLSGITLWLVIGLGVVIVLEGMALAGVWRMYVKKVNALAASEATIATMLVTAEYNTAQAEKREESWRLANEANKKRYNVTVTELARERERVRGQPSRPDGTAIPTTAGTASGADGVPEKLVPLAEYESLQDRAREDASTLVLLQDYVNGVCLFRELK